MLVRGTSANGCAAGSLWTVKTGRMFALLAAGEGGYIDAIIGLGFGPLVEKVLGVGGGLGEEGDAEPVLVEIVGDGEVVEGEVFDEVCHPGPAWEDFCDGVSVVIEGDV